MAKKSKSNDLDNELSIMLAEYELLQDFRRRAIDSAASRVRFYFSIVPAVAGTVAIASETIGIGSFFQIVIFLLDIFLLILGFNTYNRAIEFHISTVIYTRGINKIRRYFVDNYKSIDKYLSLPIHDDIPSFTKIGFSRSTIVKVGLSNAIILTNGLLAGIALYLPLTFWDNIGELVSVLVSLFLGIIIIVVQFRAYQKRMKVAEDEYKTQFPRE